MTDIHAQLAAWLADGALGDPPRELAVHASVCEQCTASLGAFDALELIDVGAAGSPPSVGARSPLRVGMAWARVGTALTATVLAGLLVGFGIAQLVGSGGSATGQPREPEGTELAGRFAPSNEAAESEAAPSDATPGVAQTPTATSTPLPGVTPAPQPPPAPVATPRPPLPTATSSPTTPPTATPAPTPEPTPTPVPECNDGVDNDLDGWIDSNDPSCTSPSVDSEAPVDPHECNDGLDNDGDVYADLADPGCGGDPFDNSEAPVDPPECSDGIDNDNDGFIDLLDPRCTDALDISEGPPDPP